MRNLKLTVAYDGTDFHGFQLQSGTNLRTVQYLLMEAWHTLTKEEVTLIGAGRTDAGVHAIGQVVNFRTTHHAIPDDRIPYALNSVLPQDLRVVGCERVPLEFHARFDARSKVYEYRLYHDVFPSPIHRRYTHFVPGSLDVEAMDRAARHLEGTHDFAAVSGHHHAVHSTVRTIFRCQVEQEGQVVTIRVKGDGFLYHMVRTIAGSLIMVGKGEHEADWIKQVLVSKDRSKAGPTAPACGLLLVSVQY